jgi:hypothetical protein
MSHVEWALTNLLGPGVRLEWSVQPVLSGTHRADIGYKATPGTAGRIASELRAFPGLRFEVTQEPNGAIEGERYACTPALGIFRAAIGPHGESWLTKNGCERWLAPSPVDLLRINNLLGAAWDAELETFRYAGEGASVRWMHEVG